MSFRGSVRSLLGLPKDDLSPPDLVSFHDSVVGTTALHYWLTEPVFDGVDWHQVPARFLVVSAGYRLRGRKT